MNYTQPITASSCTGYGLVVSEENDFIREIDDRLFNTHLDSPKVELSSKHLPLTEITSEEEESDNNKSQTILSARKCPKNNTSKKTTTKLNKKDESDNDSSHDECPHKSVKKTNKSNNKKSGNQECEPEKKQKSLYKTELCRNWEETNHCRYGMKCQYAHGATDLRELDRHPKYKTQKCRTFHQTGSCPYGNRCTFRHFNLPGDALEMKNRDREEEEERQREQERRKKSQEETTDSIFSAENHKIIAQNWFAENNVLPLAGLGAIPKRNFLTQPNNHQFDHEDSLLPSNAESLLPHELLFDLESPEDEEKQPAARCPLRDYVNLPSFSNFPVPHPQSHMNQQQQNYKPFFRPWLF